jgi:hypothetical protein
MKRRGVLLTLLAFCGAIQAQEKEKKEEEKLKLTLTPSIESDVPAVFTAFRLDFGPIEKMDYALSIRIDDKQFNYTPKQLISILEENE